MTLARELAEFCLTRIPSRVTPSVERDFRRLLRDYCGVVLAGSTIESNGMMRRVMLRSLPSGAGGRQASVVGGSKTWAPVAALLNGSAAHSIELDDLHAVSSFHPGAIVFAAALAMAEAVGGDGARFRHAVIAGYEASVRVGLWITPSELFSRGLHPTGVVGAYGAVTAAAIMLDLDATRLAKAYGLVADLSSGLMEFSESGSWSKRIHTGWPAHAGCIAAELAEEGFQGSDGIFEAASGVIFAGSGRRGPAGAGNFDVETPLAIERISIKRHACCRFGHGALDSLLDLRTRHEIDPGEIASVRIGMFRDGMFLGERLPHKLAPRSVVDAQFSLFYQAASALLRGHVSLTNFAPAAIFDPAIRALACQVIVERSDALDRQFPEKYASEVEILLKSGVNFRATRDYIEGDPDHPFTEGQMASKFRELAEMSDPEGVVEIEAAIDGVMNDDGPSRLAGCMAATNRELAGGQVVRIGAEA